MCHIVLEGANGCGKTTIIKSLAQQGYQTLSSPNGTLLAKHIRSACRGTDQFSDLSGFVKFLLFSAARCDEFDKLVKDNNEVVVCDRWHISTYVYQCLLENIPVPLYEMTIHPEEKIDLVILLGGDPDVLIDRVIKERESNNSHGICSWTQQRETMKEINRLYDEELPKYLDSKKIKYVKLDTTKLSMSDTEVFVKMYIDLEKEAIRLKK